MQSHSLWESLPESTPDGVFMLDAEAKDAPNSAINLVIGAYRDHNGKPYVLDVVRKVEKILAADMSLYKEYLPIDGLKSFREASVRLLFGSLATRDLLARTASAQTLSGTGACRLAGEFFAHLVAPRYTDVYLPDPTWPNHVPVFQESGYINIRRYRYFSRETKGVDIEGMIWDLQRARDKSVVVLHLCAHNPTGADPTPEEWLKIAEVIKEKGHLCMFDSAYQGFATGDLSKDAYAARLFLQLGLEFCVAQSYAKNMGLYNERIGCLCIVSKNSEAASLAQGCLQNIIRPMYSNPPAHGARIASMILNNPDYRCEWINELKSMAARILKMRILLNKSLIDNGAPGNWDHVINQIGMFSYLGISSKVCLALKKRNVFMLPTSRISVAALTEKTAVELAVHIAAVLKMEQSKL
eukprot:Tbor_TRINITY_DN5507_c0_g1::TRINITY_DN5507_c0_g1_i2::g.12891::m.12891